MDIIYIADKPQNLTQQQKQYFQKLLLLQGQVDNPALEKIIKKTGETYQGSKTKKDIGLYLLTVTNMAITSS